MSNTKHPSWSLRKIKFKGIDISSLRKVEDYRNPFDNYQSRLARKQKIKEKIKEIEAHILEDSNKYPGLSQEQGDVIEITISQNSKILSNLKNALDKSQVKCEENEQSDVLESVVLDQNPLLFPIHEGKRIAKFDNSLSNSKECVAEEIDDNVARVSVHKYAVLIDKKVQKVKKESQTRNLEKESLEEMQNVTRELQNWATEILDKPEVLIEDKDPNLPDLDRSKAVPQHEAVDIGALDVLLNACKPSLLDSKPPIRLNVVQEMAPPDALVKNLQKTLGVNVSEPKVKTSKANAVCGHKKEKRRTHYGNWYISPKLWNEQMSSHHQDNTSKKKVESSQGLHEMIQKKLEDIKSTQEREDAEILLENTGATTKKA